MEKESLSQLLNNETKTTTELRKTIQDLKQKLDGISATKDQLLESLKSKEENLQLAKSEAKLAIETVRKKEGVIELLQSRVSKTDEVNTQIRAVIVSKDEEIKEKADALNALECAFSESKETWNNEKIILKDLLLEEQRVNSEIRLLYQEDPATDAEFRGTGVTDAEVTIDYDMH